MYRYGHYLFDNGNYEEAMEQFLASQVDAAYVLSLYPSLILPKLAHTAFPDKAESTESSSQLSRQSSNASDEMEAGSAAPTQLGELDEKETKKMNHNALMALVKYLQKKRSSIIERATVEVTDVVVSGAVHDGLSLSDPYRSKPSAKVCTDIHHICKLQLSL
jgi:Vam6/Vps39-like protein vacuolar protein sorting-associated protein 39